MTVICSAFAIFGSLLAKFTTHWMAVTMESPPPVVTGWPLLTDGSIASIFLRAQASWLMTHWTIGCC